MSRIERLALPLFATLALALAPGARAQLAVSQLPFEVTPAPPANIVMTIDDSGSMTSAFVPDSVGQYGGYNGFASSDYNKLYYNPALVYQIPPDATGAPASSPSFTAAYVDGFNTASPTVDLSSAYVPTLTDDPSAGAGQNQVIQPAVAGPAYYYVYKGANAPAGCTAPVAWNPPPLNTGGQDVCFTQVFVGATSGPGGIDERQNFANWFSFYRTRHLAIASSAAIALSDPGMSTTRIAWQGLTTCPLAAGSGAACQGWDGNVAPVDNNIRVFSGSHRTDFYSWLFRVPAANSTPTRQAWWRTGEYFRTSGPNSPYGLDPNNGSNSTTELACVSNFQVTMTDGQWNTFQETQTNFCGNADCGNVDSVSQALPDATLYTPSPAHATSTSIYSDYNTGGLADIAFYYWATNLRPDLTGTGASFQASVPPYAPDPSLQNPVTGVAESASSCALSARCWTYWNPRNDPATWPHLVNFTIGVGLTGYLTLPGLNWTQDSFGGNARGATSYLGSGSNGFTDLSLLNSSCATASGSTPQVPFPNRCNWPTISPNATPGIPAASGNGGGNAGNVYDLWHAAIDSRGQAFSAESPQDLVNALHSIVSRIEGQMHGYSGVAASAASLTTSTMLFTAGYNAADWHGTVTAYSIAPPSAGNAGSVTQAWTTDANGSIPAYAARQVFTASAFVPLGGSVTAGTTGMVFSSANQSGLTGAGMWSWLGGASLVDYLLGDPTNETPNGLRYRARPLSKLGDIVDSAPVSAGSEDFGYAAYSGSPAMPEAASYAAFLAAKAARTAMVYVGANDGMLHGFDAASGVERFAYVPHAVVPGLASLANPGYGHSFFVDGPAFVGDAYVDLTGTGGGAAWHNILVGTTGAGGKGVFALDVTNPAAFGGSRVIWDIDGTAVPSGGSVAWGNSDPDLGDTIGQPVIARMNDGLWYAVFGNGYLSTRACPVLFLVRLDNGSATRIDASGQGGACSAAGGPGANGLGAPALYDADGNGTTDFIYAGDLLGNLWRFDVRATSPAGWTSAQPLRLMQATTATGVPQSIVTAPNIGPGASGPMIYFATGHTFAVGDAADTSQQSVYGVLDSGSALGSRSALGSALGVQSVLAPDGSGNAKVTQNAVSIPSLQQAWVIDLPGSGERATETPQLLGNVLMFSTLRPTGGNPCSGGGCVSYVYAVNALTGAGGTGFLNDSIGNYDALLSLVGCIEGVTVLRLGRTVLPIWIGPTLSPAANDPVRSLRRPTATLPAGAVPPLDLSSSPFDGSAGVLGGAGRISWQEVVP